jgi:uncharacterized delta-60 repeat protein
MNPDPSREDTIPAAADMDATLRVDVHATLPVGMEQPGDMIGRYKLIEPLGEGGFGSVWRAEQSEPIRREVALKVIKAGMDSREIIARFEAERQALALMDHPNIAAVLDAGTTDSGRPFFAMELVKGAPITDYCDAQKLGIRQRLELFIPVCQAVQHAHQKAILHRDLKPSNILVAEVDGKPVPKVIDFGIAKALGSSPEAALQGSLLQTQAGAVIGTPQYMSPEQAGAAPDLDTRSDIYTLGIILYELLTGDTPLSRDSLRKAALDEVLRLVREADPKRPSSRVLPVTDLAKQASTLRQTEPAKLARTLSGDLDWIALKALEKERDRRYGSAAEFAQDLERYLKNEPVEAGPPSPVYRLRKLVRRNRLAFAAAAAIAVSLIVGIGMTTWQWQRAEEQKEKQEKLLWNASHSEHEAATNAFENGQNAEGLAHLVRALEYRPMNDVVLAASAAHAFAGSGNAWRTRSVTAFEGPVTCLAFSPDGRYLAAGSTDDNMWVIETATGRKISKIEFVSSVITVCFSPDGRFIAVGSWDDTARVVETATGKEISQTKFGDSVTAVCFSPDGRFIAAGSDDKTACVIEAASGRVINTTELADVVTLVSFSPDGRFLAVGAGSYGKKSETRVIETTAGREISKTEFGDVVTSLTYSPDGRFIAAGSWDNSTRVIEAATGKEISRTEFGYIVTSVSFSPDGRFIAAGSWDKTVRVIEAATSKEISRSEFGGTVTSVSFSPDGRFIAAGSWDKTTRVIVATTGKVISKTEYSDKVNAVAFSSDGRYLAAGSDDTTLRIFDAAVVWKINEAGFDGSVSFSPDGRYLAVRDWDKTARVVEVTTGKVISQTQFGDEVTSVCFSLDSRFIAAGSDDKTVRVIEAVTGRLISKTEFDDKVTSVDFSPDGRFIAAGSADKILRVIEVASGTEISRAETGDGKMPVSFSPDGRFIAAGGEDMTALVIEAVTGKLVYRTKTGTSLIPVSFSPDSRFIASGAAGDVRVIEAATGKEIFKTKFGYEMTSVCFSPDGRFLGVGAEAFQAKGEARVIEAATGREISKTELGNPVTSVGFSPDGRFLAVGAGEFQKEGEVRVIETATGKNIFKTEFGNSVDSVSFSPDGRYLAVGFRNRSVLTDCTLLRPDEEMVSPWTAAMRVQAGHQFHPDGRMSPISASGLVNLQEEVAASILFQAAPLAATSWQQAIINWSQMTPETRTTSPWTTETIRVAVGRWLMNESVSGCVDQASWHPLVPVSMAWLEPEPSDKDWDPVHGTARPRFLARLTLKRLHEADEKLYGRETLAEYAEWAADIMHEDLHLDAEALEAITFALERTPKDQQQLLLDVKKEIQAAISGKN